jgi:hypothetical protein
MSASKHRNYNPIHEDGFDSKIPLYNDDAFQHGIQFRAKVNRLSTGDDCVPNRGQRTNERACRCLVHWFSRSAEAKQPNRDRQRDASYSRT